MAIEMTCIGCGKILQIPEAAAGKKGKCPKCGTINVVPGDAPIETLVTAEVAEPPPLSHSRPSTGRVQEPAQQTPREWFCHVGGEKFGPIKEAEIKNWIREGRISPTDQVWTDSMSAWAPLSTVQGILGVVAVPPPERAPMTPVLTMPKRKCIRCGYAGHMGKKWDSWVVPVAIITAIFTMGLGLLFLLVPKHYNCPKCGATFDSSFD